ncbi:MAG: oxidoreductase [Betaproteobacteria bacterium]|nr:oxidoreductase [Betaproteobacteria bacterium]
MPAVTPPAPPPPRTFSAIVLQSRRITPPASREEVRHLVLRTSDLSFDASLGNLIRVLAPGQFGARSHARLYSIMDLERHKDATEFAICVRRCSYIDEFNGEEYRGVASNYLCDLKPDDPIVFVGPVGYPFVIPEDKTADILMLGMGTGIAPFRTLIRQIYEKIGGWQGKVRLFYGAKSPLEMLYMNDENSDLANYFDQPTFKAFQAVSPRPAIDAPVALAQALEQTAAEVWEMLQRPNTRVFVAGTEDLLGVVEQAMIKLAGSGRDWLKVQSAMKSSGRWSEVLY